MRVTGVGAASDPPRGTDESVPYARVVPPQGGLSTSRRIGIHKSAHGSGEMWTSLCEI